MCIPLMPADQNLVLSGDYALHIVVSKITMNEVMRIVNNVGAGDFTTGKGLFDNLAGDMYYINTNTTYLTKLKWISGSSSFTFQASIPSPGSGRSSSFMNIGSINYIAFVHEFSPVFAILSKTDLGVYK